MRDGGEWRGGQGGETARRLGLDRRGGRLGGSRSLGSGRRRRGGRLGDHQALRRLVDGGEEGLLREGVVEHLGDGLGRGLRVRHRADLGLEPHQVDAGGPALGVGDRDGLRDGGAEDLELPLLLLDAQPQLRGDGADLGSVDDGDVAHGASMGRCPGVVWQGAQPCHPL